MSDLAILHSAEAESENARSLAILDPSRRSGGGNDANFLALLRSLPGSVSVISGEATAHLDQTDPAFQHVAQKNASKSLSGAHAIVVVCPRFDTFRETAYLARLSLRSRITGRVFVMVAVAAKPTGGRIARLLKRIAIRNADLTIVRDEASADALLAAGVEGPLRIGADPAWTELGDLFAAREREDRLVVAIDERLTLAQLESLESAIQAIAATGTEVCLQPWPSSEGAENSTTEELGRRLGESVTTLAAPTSLREARDLYASSRAVVTTRFHALMAAAASGTPTLAVGQGSTADLADTLGVDSVPSSLGSGEMGESLAQVLANGSVAGSAVPSFIDRARASLDLVHFTLSEGADSPSTANEPLPLYPSPWRQ